MGVDLFDALGGTVTLGSVCFGRQQSLSTVAAVNSDKPGKDNVVADCLLRAYKSEASATSPPVLPEVDQAWDEVDTSADVQIIFGSSSAGPLQPLTWPSGPWRRISVDIAGPFVDAPHHQRFIMAAVDHFSKWPEAAVCGIVTSSAVIDFLTSLFDRYGLIEEIVTDNGVQFTSAEFQTFLKQHGIRHCRTSLYAPQANGAVERFNRVIKEGIKANMAEGRSFMTSLRQTLATYRVTPHSTTNVTPSSLMLAFSVRTPLSMLARPKSSASRPSVQALRKAVKFKQEAMATDHDRRSHARPTAIRSGDLVRILLPRRSHKLAQSYSEPSTVKSFKGNCVTLQNGQRWNIRRCLRVNPTSEEPRADSSLDNSDDRTSFSFPVGDPSIVQSPEHEPVRRSARIRIARDFGPVVSH